MKRIFLSIMLALPMLLLAQYSSGIKMGVVDESVIEQLPQYTEAQAQVKAISDRYKAEYDKLEADMNKKVTEFQAMNLQGGTPENIKMLRIQEIQSMNARIQEFRNAATADLQKQEETKLQPVRDLFNQTIEAVAKDGGYTVIYLKGSVAYTNTNVVDITPLVLARLSVQ